MIKDCRNDGGSASCRIADDEDNLVIIVDELYISVSSSDAVKSDPVDVGALLFSFRLRFQ